MTFSSVYGSLRLRSCADYSKNLGLSLSFNWEENAIQTTSVKRTWIVWFGVGLLKNLENTLKMAGHDPEKFDGMFLAMCQRSEKGIDEVV